MLNNRLLPLPETVPTNHEITKNSFVGERVRQGVLSPVIRSPFGASAEEIETPRGAFVSATAPSPPSQEFVLPTKQS